MRELYEPQAILPDGIEVTKPAVTASEVGETEND
jgi:hypothetical protein